MTTSLMQVDAQIATTLPPPLWLKLPVILYLPETKVLVPNFKPITDLRNKDYSHIIGVEELFFRHHLCALIRANT